MDPASRLLWGIAYEAVLIFLLIGAIFGLCYGLALVLRQSWPMRLNAGMNRWFSTRRAMKGLEIPRDIQRPLYRQHRGLGLFIVTASAFVLYVLVARYEAAPIIAYFSRYMRPGVVSWLLDWFTGFVLVANIFTLLIGLVLLLRPSLLKGLENWANRSYSGRSLGRVLDMMHMGVDRWVMEYPRAAGALIVAAGLYAAVSLTWLLVLGSR